MDFQQQKNSLNESKDKFIFRSNTQKVIQSDENVNNINISRSNYSGFHSRELNSQNDQKFYNSNQQFQSKNDSFLQQKYGQENTVKSKKLESIKENQSMREPVQSSKRMESENLNFSKRDIQSQGNKNFEGNQNQFNPKSEGSFLRSNISKSHNFNQDDEIDDLEDEENSNEVLSMQSIVLKTMVIFIGSYIIYENYQTLKALHLDPEFFLSKYVQDSNYINDEQVIAINNELEQIQDNKYFDSKSYEVVEYSEKIHSLTDNHPNKHPGEFFKNQYLNLFNSFQRFLGSKLPSIDVFGYKLTFPPTNETVSKWQYYIVLFVNLFQMLLSFLFMLGEQRAAWFFIVFIWPIRQMFYYNEFGFFNTAVKPERDSPILKRRAKELFLAEARQRQCVEELEWTLVMSVGMLVILSSRRYGPGQSLRLFYRTVRRTWRNIRHFIKHLIKRQWLFLCKLFNGFFQKINEWNDSEE